MYVYMYVCLWVSVCIDIQYLEPTDAFDSIDGCSNIERIDSKYNANGIEYSLSDGKDLYIQSSWKTGFCSC